MTTRMSLRLHLTPYLSHWLGRQYLLKERVKIIFNLCLIGLTIVFVTVVFKSPDTTEKHFYDAFAVIAFFGLLAQLPKQTEGRTNR